MDRADVIAIGPGLGQERWGRDLFAATVTAKQVLVLDADALNLLASQPMQRSDWILTPHPGEAARLLGTTTGQIQKDRFGAAQELSKRYGGIAILKGACSWVASEGTKPVVCDRGNPGMATGGMGDVLTGVVAGLAAQGMTLWESACAGVLVHGLAGDVASRAGERGMLASDLFPHLRTFVNPIRQRT
jgi:NAD(P)H-hydrate epimerase